MVAPLVVAGIVSAVGSIIGGITSSNAASAEARRAEQYSAYNAAAQRERGNTQASLTMMPAMYNAMNMKKQASYNASLTGQSIEYNTDVARSVNAYNDLLLADQIDQVFEEAELNGEMLHRDYTKARSTTIGQQASSGTTIGTGSNLDTIADMTAEESLFALIIDNNANKQVASLENARAKGTWETEMQIQKMAYEGQLSISSMMYGANADAAATLFGGMMNAKLQMEGAGNQATGTLIQGGQTASNQRAQSSMYMTQGLMSGASSLVSAYGAGAKQNLVNTDDSLLSGGK